MVLSEGSRVLMTETENPIVLGLWSSYEVCSFASQRLGSLLHMLYRFQDVLRYHSNAVSKVAAASHACRSIKREINQLGHFKWLKPRHSLSDFQKQGILF